MDTLLPQEKGESPAWGPSGSLQKQQTVLPFFSVLAPSTAPLHPALSCLSDGVTGLGWAGMSALSGRCLAALEGQGSVTPLLLP